MFLDRRLCSQASRFIAFAALAVSSSAFGAGPVTRTIQTTKQFQISPVAISSTYDIQPQIQPDPPPGTFDMRAENDITPMPPREAANALRAGGLLSTTRGRVGAYFPGPTDGRWFPADPQMAVGPNHVVCIINSKIAFYTKSGTKTFETLIDTGANSFFNGVADTTFVFDPKAFYDSISNRFFVIADDGANQNGVSNIVLAVSDDNDPNGTWYKYKFNTAVSGGWMDYPGFGFNKDAIVITGNLFDGSVGGTEALVIKKAPLLTGGTSTVSQILDGTTFTLQPTRTTDPGSDKVFGVASGGGNAIRFFAFTNLTGTPLLKEVDVAVPTYARPPGPAPSGSTVLDTLDGRQMTAAYRNGQVVAAHTIGINTSIAVRWYDFNVNTWPASGNPTLKQSGNITGSGVAMHMPAININSFEDISVMYTRSSASVPAQICQSSRVKTDTLGQIGQPVVLASSASGTYGGRWGDYFVNEIDPVDDATFWGFGMVSGAGGSISTQVVKWTVTQGGATGTEVPPTTINTFVGDYLIGDIASVTSSDDLYYQVGSAAIPQFGQAAGVEAEFTVPASTSMTVSLESIAGINGGTNMVWMFNWATNQYVLIGSTPMSASGNTTRTLIVRSTDVAKYINGAGTVRVRVRGHLPIRPFNNQIPNPFTYQIDKLVLFVR